MSVREWKKYKLAELGKLARGKSKHRPRDATFLYGGPYPFIQTGNIKSANHKIFNFNQTYSEAGLSQSKLWPIGTIAITIAANIADTGILTFPACFPDSVLGFTANKDKCDVDFVEYLLQFYKKQIQSHAIGSVQDNINLGTFENVEFEIPDLPTQSRIAAILSALDDKIELNRRTNTTLEAIAQAIFKEWFVDFRFPGATGEIQDSELGLIPKGWRTGLFADFAEITGGGTPKTSIKEYWDGDIPWFSVVDAPDKSDVFVIDTNKKITQSGIDNSSARVLKEGTTIISARGTVGKVALCGLQMAMNQSCYAINGNQDHSGFYTYFLTRSASSQLEQGANGSVFDTITRNSFEQLTIILPPIELITCFNSLVEPILLRIKEHLHQIAALAQTRDTLLPKLMSGEIEV